MGNLQKLKLAREDKNVATDDAGRRRNKLLNKLREQLLIVRSDFGGEPYKPKKRIWLTKSCWIMMSTSYKGVNEKPI